MQEGKNQLKRHEQRGQTITIAKHKGPQGGKCAEKNVARAIFSTSTALAPGRLSEQLLRLKTGRTASVHHIALGHKRTPAKTHGPTNIKRNLNGWKIIKNKKSKNAKINKQDTMLRQRRSSVKTSLHMCFCEDSYRIY